MPVVSQCACDTPAYQSEQECEDKREVTPEARATSAQARGFIFDDKCLTTIAAHERETGAFMVHRRHALFDLSRQSEIG